MPFTTQQFFQTIDLLDVSATLPSDGEILVYNVLTGRYEPTGIASGGLVALGDLSDVTITSVASGELLKYNGSGWVNNTLAEAGVAPAIHTHGASDIVSGTLDDARLSSNVGLLDTGAIWTGGQQFDSFFITGSGGRSGISSAATASRALTLADSDGELPILSDVSPASGEFMVRNGSGTYDSRQLLESDISDLGTYIADPDGKDDGDILIYNGGSIAAWEPISFSNAGISEVGHSHNLGELSDVTISSVASGEVLVFNGSNWINRTFAEAQISQDGHTHSASDITSGTFADARISESSVTQHEAALTITESQISDLGTYYSAGDTIRAADGTLGAPGLSFNNHTDFGLYMQSSTRMDIVANGTSVAQLTNNTIFSTAVFQAEVTQFVASLSWVSSSTDAIFTNTTASTGAKITLREGTTNGTSGISFSAPNSLASSTTYTLPSADGSADQVLKTDGSGNLSWVDNDDKFFQNDSGYETPTNRTYVISQHLPEQGGTLETIYYKSASGTCTVNIQIDGVSVTSWSALSVSSTEGNTASTGANTFSGGETLTAVFTSVSSADMVSISIKGTFD